MDIKWLGFYKKSVKERQSQLKLIFPHLASNTEDDEFPIQPLIVDQANIITENCVSVIGLPLSIVPSVRINGVPYTVPVSTEEAAVVASASYVCSRFEFQCDQDMKGYPGFKDFDGNVCMAQVMVPDISVETLKGMLGNNDEIKGKLEESIPSIVQRGGGIIGIDYEQIDSDVVVNILINCCHAMGSNISTKIASIFCSLVGVQSYGICSNYCPLVTIARFSVKVSDMAYKGKSGEEVCEGIIRLYNWAKRDSKRAKTHNKGIMNGISAVALAAGQDCRAIHASLTSDLPLTEYYIKDGVFHGELKAGFQMATVGGSINSNPAIKHCLGLISQNLTPEVLRYCAACVGLACNFAALRAIATGTIYDSHMKLHARNVAVSAGAPSHLIDDITHFIITGKRSVSSETVKAYLEAHHVFTSHQKESGRQQAASPSILFVHREQHIIHIMFPTVTSNPLILDLASPSDESKRILGDKSYDWFEKLLTLLQTVFEEVTGITRRDPLLPCCILLQIVYRRLLQQDTRIVCSDILEESKLRFENQDVKVGISLGRSVAHATIFRAKAHMDDASFQMFNKLLRKCLDNVALSYRTEDRIQKFIYRSSMFMMPLVLLLGGEYDQVGEYLNYECMFYHEKGNSPDNVMADDLISEARKQAEAKVGSEVLQKVVTLVKERYK
jgi:degradative hydroxymethylglutaryl-CoA reductase